MKNHRRSNILEPLGLYMKLAGARITSQMQYPTSFVVGIILSFLASFIDVIGLFIIFTRFKFVAGWHLAEVCLLYGLLHMSFSLVEMVARGFDTFGRLIRQGHLDRILVRPRGIALQVLGQEFKTANLGRFLQGLVPFIYAVKALEITGPYQWSLIGLSLLISSMTFYALMLVQATMAFWAQDSIEVMNAFVYGGMQAGQMPMSIYEGWLVRFFTFVVPIALCAYYPALLILNRQDQALGLNPHGVVALAPLWVALLLYGAHRLFQFGLRHYSTTG